jgi:hypothetical protein
MEDEGTQGSGGTRGREVVGGVDVKLKKRKTLIQKQRVVRVYVGEDDYTEESAK